MIVRASAMAGRMDQGRWEQEAGRCATTQPAVQTEIRQNVLRWAV